MDRPRSRGNFRGNRERFDHRSKFGNRERKWQFEEKEIEELKCLYETVESSQLKEFSDFPLSFKTKQGLQHAKYVDPTDIQRESILLALKGHDILGAAKTGSGKTLAFLIPLLEKLFSQKWTQLDGLGALVITPTRELAYQIFEVLRKIGRSHDFSAGLVIGGKNLKEEAQSISRTNIVICTPGRLLQHMDETVHFNADNLQILVLDEADRILDLGFQQSMNAIIENLPASRQTLLFSATQTKSVKDLARLSLKDPMYVSVHEKSEHSTPTKLEQSYMVCELHEKLDLLWSFIKNHLKSKILVFLSSCKQVRFIHEIFRKLRPGTNVMALHGAMPQLKRMAMYDGFVRKQNAVLFATDIAARGLDFPAVQWVVQLDCPEDANTYIHRAGRTARYETNGEALLVLLPSEEEAMVKQLKEKKIPVNKIKVNPKRLWSVQGKIDSLCASDIQLKEYAQRAFVSYLKSVFLMSNKPVFSVTSLDTDKYARSLGLAISPRVRFIKKEEKRLEQKRILTAKKKVSSDSDEASSDSGNADSSSAESEEAGPSQTNQDTYRFGADDDSDDDILTVKKGPKREVPGDSLSEEETSDEGEDQPGNKTEMKEKMEKKKDKTLSKAALAKKLHKKNIVVNKKVVFDEEGEAIHDVHKKSSVAVDEDLEVGGIDIEQARRRMAEEDKIDKQLYREKIKQKHREERLKKRDENRKRSRPAEQEEEEMVAVIGGENSEDEIERLEATLGTSDNEEEMGGYDREESERVESQSTDSSEGDNKVRGEDSSGSEEGSGEDDEDEDDEDDSGSDDEEEEKDDSPPKKKIRKNAAFETGLSLEDDEAIALRLLQNS